MLLSIEPDGPVAIYQQIRDRIVEAIADGELPAGSSLPATRQLAVDLGINFHTVNKAYDLLRQEGLLRIGRKSGAVVARDAASGPPRPGWEQDWAGRCGRCSPRPPLRACPQTTSSGTARPRWPGSLSPPRQPRPAPRQEPGHDAGRPDRVRRRAAVRGADVRGAGGHPADPAVRGPDSPAYTGAAVIRRERRAYYWRTAAVAVCCAALAIIFWGSGSRWLPRIILLLEVAADVGCLWLARRKIIAVKTAEGWFAGLRQTVVADTSWRTQPQPFPVRWLIPAISVFAATTVIGVIRYPHLPAHLATGLATLGGRRVPRSPVSAFAMVIAQLSVTGMWTGLMVLIYRSRPDIDAADPAASVRRYRRLLDGYARAALTMLALVDLTFLLAALQIWQL